MRNHWRFLTLLLTVAIFLTLISAGAALASAVPASAPNPNDGLVIVLVDDAAAESGIVRGDVLLEIDGKAVNDAADWSEATASLEAGDQVSLLIRHGDEVREVKMRLAEEGGSPDFGFQPYFEDAMMMSGTTAVPFGHMLAAEPGVMVAEVTADSPAEAAGLQKGDRIVAIDGAQLRPRDDFAALISGHKPGDEITLTIVRDDEEQEVAVTLGEHPEREGAAFLGIRYQQAVREFNQMPMPGQPMPFGRSFGSAAVQGALLGRVIADSPADAAGLKAGDIITAADDQPVESPQDLIDILAEHQPGDTITIEFQRPGRQAAGTSEVALAEHPDKEGAAYLGVEFGNILRFDQTQPGDELPEGFSPDQLFRFFQRRPGQDQSPGFRLPFELPFELPFDLKDLPHNFDLPDLNPLPGQPSGNSQDL